MPTSEKTVTKNALTAIVLYELSRLDTLPPATQSLVASELTVAITTLRMSQQYADEAFHESQAAYYSAQKREVLEQRNQQDNQVSFAIASIMHCVHKAHAIDGLQNEIITSTIEWVRKTVTNNGK